MEDAEMMAQEPAEAGFFTPKFSRAYHKLALMAAKDNIADDLDELTLKKMGNRVIEEYEADLESRSDWERQNKEAMKLAKQVYEEKSWPWANAANVKLPIIANAAIQFAARAYPEIIRDDRVVKAQAIGDDPTGEKGDRADRISTHMSYQLLEEMEEWERDTDSLLHAFAVIGTLFRKTYYCPLERRNKTELRFPDKCVVNYHAQTMDTARRVSDVLDYYENDVIERQRGGVFRDVELRGEGDEEGSEHDKRHCFIEQHRWWDLDGDGYEEPYVVTVHQETKEVVRIVARFDMDGVQANAKGQIVRIKPVCYFTDYHFIPAFDGGFYSVGFGFLLSPLNQTANTVINQLLDAGTLSNLQSGFISEQVRMPKGSQRFAPGEWKSVKATGRLADGVYPLPVKEPSNVLFALLGTIMEQANELANIKDVLSGDAVGQGIPATTVLAMIEQGMKTFNAIYKRVYRSLKSEFKKLYRLNAIYLDDQQYFKVLDTERAVTRQDYNYGDCDVVPVANPTVSTEMQRMAQAEALMQLRGSPNVDAYQIEKFYIEQLRVPEVERFIPEKDPNQPDPQQVMMQQQMEQQQQEAQRKQQELQLKAIEQDRKENELELKEAETRAKIGKMYAEAMKTLAEAESEEVGTQLSIYKQQLEGLMADIGETNGNQRRVSGLETPPSDPSANAVPQGQAPGNPGGADPLLAASDLGPAVQSGAPESGLPGGGQPGFPA